jgi:hypothetical protein
MHNEEDTVGPLLTRSNSDGSCDDGVTLLGSAADDDADGSASKQLGHRRTNSGLGDVLKGLFSPLSGLSIRLVFYKALPNPFRCTTLIAIPTVFNSDIAFYPRCLQCAYVVGCRRF